MKKIPLTQGKFSIVDDEDYLQLSKNKWVLSLGRKTNYARRMFKYRGKQYGILMHHQILMPSVKDQIDHIDGNGLNNQKKNLRVCSRFENQRNRGPNKNNKSGYKGVSWCRKKRKWVVFINAKSLRKHIGSFEDKVDAAIAYNKWAKRLFGEFAYLNPIPCSS